MSTNSHQKSPTQQSIVQDFRQLSLKIQKETIQELVGVVCEKVIDTNPAERYPTSTLIRQQQEAHLCKLPGNHTQQKEYPKEQFFYILKNCYQHMSIECQVYAQKLNRTNKKNPQSKINFMIRVATWVYGSPIYQKTTNSLRLSEEMFIKIINLYETEYVPLREFCLQKGYIKTTHNLSKDRYMTYLLEYQEHNPNNDL